ncbi:prepilin peptidase [Dialister sp.]|uniref:prepilin peptidase n=1 Tax=Dialister sp. TaxID=1955814 RepID=UPI003F01C46B
MKTAEAEGKCSWDRLWSDRKWLALWLAGSVLYACLLGHGWYFLSPAVFIVLLLLPAAEDWQTGYISDGWSFLLASCGLMTAFWQQDMKSSFLAGILTFSLYGLIHIMAKESSGTGDIFLSAGAAFWLEPVSCLLFIWFSALTAALFLAVPLLLGKKSLQEEVRFGPFIALGGMMAYGWQEIWGLSFPPAWFPFG